MRRCFGNMRVHIYPAQFCSVSGWVRRGKNIERRRRLVFVLSPHLSLATVLKWSLSSTVGFFFLFTPIKTRNVQTFTANHAAHSLPLLLRCLRGNDCSCVFYKNTASIQMWKNQVLPDLETALTTPSDFSDTTRETFNKIQSTWRWTIWGCWHVSFNLTERACNESSL